MDSLRGNFDAPDFTDASNDYDLHDEEAARDLPPAAIGQDERRMQVRAYNHWASMLGERNFPSIEELEPENLPDFGPYSVLLDFSTGIEDPAIQFLGNELAAECGADSSITRLSDIPSRSLLSRITDHYLQILANQAPIGFEAEFVNDSGVTILYRGILLPFSSDNESIDFIYGVINWKEMAEQAEADELLLEIDQALETEEDEPVKRDSGPLTDWADRPSEDAEVEVEPFESSELAPNISDIEPAFSDSEEAGDGPLEFPEPAFGDYNLDDEEEEGEDEGEANYDFASLADHIAAPAKKALSLDLDDLAEPSDPSDDAADFSEDAPVGEEPLSEPVGDFDFGSLSFGRKGSDDVAEVPSPELPVLEESEPEFTAELPEEAGIYDYLAVAREAAQNAQVSEDRSRKSLYEAVGLAFDFSIAADQSPEDYAELLAESGLEVQARAPMTPVVKLVFGVDYDKTRLTEYAAVLSYAQRVGISQGGLAEYLEQADGGLKGVVNAERRWRKEQAGKDVEPENEVRSAIAKKLRKLEIQDFGDLAPDGGEFALVMIRRTEDGDVVMLGEIEQDIPLIERAARKLIG